MVVFSKLVKSCCNSKMWIIGEFIPPYNFATVITTMMICFIGYYLFSRMNGDSNFSVRDFTKYHNWISIKVTSKSWYCSICEALLLDGIGMYCDCCGICADSECINKANSKLVCKAVSTGSESHTHHWVKGNLPLGAVCDVCFQDCCLEPGLIDYQCCWCQRTVHDECLTQMDLSCDFGPFRKMIIPPYCIQTAKRKGALGKLFLLKAIKDPGWQEWSPVIVIANKRSGNSDGALLLSEFRKYLNPAQVVDLSQKKLIIALQLCVLLLPRRVTILVGGGDGTVSSVLTSAYKLDLDPEPAIAIVPLGTGNDLSRVLGWGKAYDPETSGECILKNIESAKRDELDRWRTEIISSGHLGIRIPSQVLYTYNYLSIGVDAQVALNFHKTRDGPFYIFQNRIFNKILYLLFGTRQVVNSECKNLEKKLDLYLDDRRIDLPELESIVVLNIPSWGAGVDLWGMCGTIKSQSINDSILEVVGLYSSLHMAQLQVGLSTPYKIGQAKIVEIKLKSKAPIQIDGEPWEQSPAIIKITCANKCSVLINQNKE